LGAADGVDFNGLDAGLWEALAKLLLAALPVFGATVLRALAAGVRAGVFDPPRMAFAGAFLAVVLAAALGDSLEDFLRVFLDIRLPFVAFRGSIIRVLRVSSQLPDSLWLLGKFDDLGVWLQGIRGYPRPLVEGAPE
jgi:hypothetical protein